MFASRLRDLLAMKTTCVRADVMWTDCSRMPLGAAPVAHASFRSIARLRSRIDVPSIASRAATWTLERRVDCGDRDAVDADWVGPVGRACREDSCERSGVVASWMDLQYVAHSLMEPGDGDQIHTGAHAVERGSESLFDLEDRLGRAVCCVAGSVLALTKHRPDEADRFNDEPGAGRRHVFSVAGISELNTQICPSGSRNAALRTPRDRSIGP